MNNKWQIIDSPGILDHPIEEMNTIEMQSICSFAHLDACILFFIDLSESCGYNIEDQISLLKNTKSLFKNKPIIIVISKSDIENLNNTDNVKKSLINNLLNEIKQLRIIEISSKNNYNTEELKKLACELFTEYKLKQNDSSDKINNILSRMHITTPNKRDNIKRVPVQKPTLMNDDNKLTAKDMQDECGGSGVF